MTHPLDAIVDGILERAAREGLLDALPGVTDLLAPHRDGSGRVAASLDPSERSRATVTVLTDLIERARSEMSRLPGPVSRAVRSAEIADLRLRLAAELQAMRRHGSSRAR